MRLLWLFFLSLTYACSGYSSSLDQLEIFLMDQTPSVAENKLHSVDLVREAYKANDYTLIWQNQKAINQALDEIANSWLEGLTPNDYHFDALQSLTADAHFDSNDVEFDLLLTDAIMTYATHLIRGKVNPESLSTTWNYQLSTVSPQKAVELLLYHVKNSSVPEGIAQLKPKLPQYQKLKDLLVFFNQQSQPFINIELQTRALKPEQRDQAVPLIRARLAKYRLIDPIAVDNDSFIYTGELVEAVKKLQQISQLTADGVIGVNTLDVLNIRPEQRVNAIIANLERIRWIENSLSDDFLIVNIAGYELYLYRDGKSIWHSNVIVGKNYSKTPVFKAQMDYIVVNPTWTVPRSIARGMISKIKNNSQYLVEKDFSVVDSRRNPIDAATIDWANVTPSEFPYWFVQRPSEANSLGQIKFMLPNKYSIYLHDTPVKELFGREQRTFSHGCVRVDQPFELAENILADEEQWSQSALQSLKDTGETTRLNLAKPLDVLIMYWTVSINQDGVHFYPDVYGRDKNLIEKLVKPL